MEILMFKKVSDKYLEELDRKINIISSTHAEQEKYHYQALNKPQYIFEHIPELIFENGNILSEECHAIQFSAPIIDEKPSYPFKTANVSKLEKEVARLAGEVKYLRDKLEERSTKKKKSIGKEPF
jgi:hypothetical protein